VGSPWRRMYALTQSLVSAEQLIDAALIATRQVEAKHATATLWEDPCLFGRMSSPKEMTLDWAAQ